jgi:anti-sigma B factor antagonist
MSVPVTVSSDEEPPLSLDLSSHGTVTVIRVSGELDMSTAHLLTDLVETVAASRPARVVVDMAEVTFLCAAGLGALITARDMILAAGGQLVLRAPSPQTRRILTITQTYCLFRPDTSDPTT